MESKRKRFKGQTCTMFLNDLTRKFHAKKKLEEEEEERVKIVESIIESITNALPFKFSKKSSSIIKPVTQPEVESKNTTTKPKQKEPTPMEVDNGSVAMEILEKDTSLNSNVNLTSKQPRMPIVNSDAFKFLKVQTFDAAVNTTEVHDVAYEITKHVGTLKRIALIAEDFNQKTARNLKEIVDSVQDDLVRKIEEIRQAKIAASTVDTIDGEEIIV